MIVNDVVASSSDSETSSAAEVWAVSSCWARSTTDSARAARRRANRSSTVALMVAAIILLAGAWGAVRGGAPRESSRRVQLQARRDRLFAELAALEEQRRKGSVDAHVYASRREHLVTALEDLYAGLEREVA